MTSSVYCLYQERKRFIADSCLLCSMPGNSKIDSHCVSCRISEGNPLINFGVNQRLHGCHVREAVSRRQPFAGKPRYFCVTSYPPLYQFPHPRGYRACIPWSHGLAGNDIINNVYSRWKSDCSIMTNENNSCPRLTHFANAAMPRSHYG